VELLKMSGISDFGTELSWIAIPAAGAEKPFPLRAAWFVVNICDVHNRLNPSFFGRAVALRVFGESIGEGVTRGSGMRVKLPWKLCVGDGADIGEGSFSTSMGRLAGDRDRYSRYSANTRQMVEDTFSIKAVFDRLEGVYEKVISEEKRA